MMDNDPHGPPLADLLTQARSASRWVADYQRRLLTYLHIFEGGIQKALPAITFDDWTPFHYKTVPKASTAPYKKRTAWHFLPLLAVRLRWLTAPTPAAGGAKVVLRISLDSGWSRDPNDRHPDPGAMADAARCTSPVQAWVHRVIGEGFSSWGEVEKEAVQQRAQGEVLDIQRGTARLLSRHLVLDLVDLPDRAALERRLIEPIAAVLRI